jgi:hypothetical protein
MATQKQHQNKNSRIVSAVITATFFLFAGSSMADSALSLPIEQTTTKAQPEIAADGNAQCADVIKECFLMSPEKKTQCYFSRGQHPFCAGTTLGEIALTRWNYSKDEAGSDVMALTGETSVSAQCLSQFDKQWSAALLSGSSTELTYKKLLAQLNECQSNAAPEVESN